MRIAVVGATSWGVTLGWLLANGGNDVAFVTRDTEEAERLIARRGLARIPEVVLPAAVTASAVLPGGCEGIVAAVPVQAIRRTFAALDGRRDLTILCASKGIELASGLLPSGVFESLGWDAANVAALSGPNLAHEVAKGMPAAAVVAANEEPLAARWQQAFTLPSFRVYRTGDVTGVELAGALKNVVAIAAGAAVGLGFGANTIAAILTRGLAEISRLGVARGADPATFQGLAGIGDLAATCFSPLSRNRRLGEQLALGATPAEAIRSLGVVAEGAATAPAAVAMARESGVQMPIAEAVAAVLGERLGVQDVMAALLARDPRPEEFARFGRATLTS